MNQLLNGDGNGCHIQLSLEWYVFFQGSGFVVVIDATEWEYETHMRHTKDRVVSATYIYCIFTWFILDSCVVCCISLPHSNSQLANQKQCLLSWHPVISSPWPDMAMISYSAELGYGKYLIVLFLQPEAYHPEACKFSLYVRNNAGVF